MKGLVLALLLVASACRARETAGTSASASAAPSQAVAAPTGKVVLGELRVEGNATPDAVRKVVESNLDAVRRCYADALHRDAKLSGTVATRFVLDPQGKVTSIGRDPATTIDDRALVHCVGDSFSKSKFPAPEGGIVMVVVPMTLTPSE